MVINGEAGGDFSSPPEDGKESYSFSKLSAFHTCRYGYQYRYIEKDKGITNAFSSYGSEMHSILERYAKGELELWDLASVFEWEYESAVPEKFPKSKFCDFKKTYYEQGMNFLKNFQGYDDYNILAAEEKFFIPISDWVFNGVVDSILERKEDGMLILQDYKSKGEFKSKAEQQKYARQLYLYSIFVKAKYGRYPDVLRFLMFRKNKTVDIPFDELALQEAIDWANNTVKEIRNCFDYYPSCEDFYGNNLCNYRKKCKYLISSKKEGSYGKRKN